MKDNIMYYPSIVLMVVEAAALVFLIWSWFDAKWQGVPLHTGIQIQ